MEQFDLGPDEQREDEGPLPEDRVSMAVQAIQRAAKECQTAREIFQVNGMNRFEKASKRFPEEASIWGEDEGEEP